MEKFIKDILKKHPDLLVSKHLKEGHEDRFLEKLKALEKPTPKLVWRKKSITFLSIAAGIALLFGVFQWGAYTQSKEVQINAITPVATKLNAQYSKPIAKAISELALEATPLTRPHINKALEKVASLAANMEALEEALLEGGNTQLILQAMIQNYQTRIELLEAAANQIEIIKSINKNSHETI